MRFADVIKTGGLSALAAAMAITALPDDAMARRDGDRGGFSHDSSKREPRSNSNSRSSRSESRTAPPRASYQPNVVRTPQRSTQSYRQPPPAAIQRAAVPPSTAQYRSAQSRNSNSVNRSYADANRNRSYSNASRNRTYRSAESTRRTTQGYTGSGYNQRRFADRDGDRNYQNRNYRGDYRNDSRNYRNDSRNYRYDRDHDRDRRQWNRGWRNDHRYDWYDYRNRNRSIFHVGFYYAPYRYWSYRPLSIGFYLDSLFYSSRYWIDDPWRYRLPEVYGPYRWVRYYDDVLLVDIYSGEVVDVIHNFFW